MSTREEEIARGKRKGTNDELDDVNGFGLTDSVASIDSLLLDGRVPPKVHLREVGKEQNEERRKRSKFSSPRPQSNQVGLKKREACDAPGRHDLPR